MRKLGVRKNEWLRMAEKWLMDEERDRCGRRNRKK